jgi:excisionase family DNA binding protein
MTEGAIIDGELYTVEQAAAFAHVSKKTLYRWVEAGEIQARGIGRKFLFLGADLRAVMMTERKRGPKAKAEPVTEPQAEPQEVAAPKPKGKSKVEASGGLRMTPIDREPSKSEIYRRKFTLG